MSTKISLGFPESDYKDTNRQVVLFEVYRLYNWAKPLTVGEIHFQMNENPLLWQEGPNLIQKVSFA